MLIQLNISKLVFILLLNMHTPSVKLIPRKSYIETDYNKSEEKENQSIYLIDCCLDFKILYSKRKSLYSTWNVSVTSIPSCYIDC
jgi:hypothetical protein